MKHFSIARDLGPNGLITFIKRARRYGTLCSRRQWIIRLIGCCFDVDTNQNVNPKYYDALARYYVRYLQEYEKNGIFVDYLSLFNEPGVYTKIHYSDIRDLLRDHVGRCWSGQAYARKLMLSEAPERNEAYRNYPTRSR